MARFDPRNLRKELRKKINMISVPNKLHLMCATVCKLGSYVMKQPF